MVSAHSAGCCSSCQFHHLLLVGDSGGFAHCHCHCGSGFQPGPGYPWESRGRRKHNELHGSPGANCGHGGGHSQADCGTLVTHSAPVVGQWKLRSQGEFWKFKSSERGKGRG